jgi:hypothetical protein
MLLSFFIHKTGRFGDNSDGIRNLYEIKGFLLASKVWRCGFGTKSEKNLGIERNLKKVLANAIFLVYNIKCCDIDSVEA